MNLALYIARRYLFSKKSHNAINVISGIAVCGVALATLALVCTLSVFNGFHDLISSFFTHFDPQLKVEAVRGKTFAQDSAMLASIRQVEGVEVVSMTLEDHAMAKYQEQQAMVTIKGVDDDFEALTGVGEILYGNPEFKLYDAVADYGIPGIQLMYILGMGMQPFDPIEVYAPRTGTKVNMTNPLVNFRRMPLYSPGTVLNIIGLMTAIFGWYSYQRPIWTALGLFLQIFGCAGFMVGQYLPTVNKDAAKWRFIRANCWLVSFIPLALICNMITGFGFHQFRPIPILFWRTRLRVLRLALWPCCYLGFNLIASLWARKKARQLP